VEITERRRVAALQTTYLSTWHFSYAISARVLEGVEKPETMFTGLIQRVGEVQTARRSAGGMVFSVRLPVPFDDPLVPGESIAVDGICLTVTSFAHDSFTTDASAETLDRSTLGLAHPGKRLNVERALRPLDRMGGHVVLGHVDCRGRVTGIEDDGRFRRFRFHLPGEHTRLLVEKGSVAVDGISLTVASCADATFSVTVIPATLDTTNLKDRRVGDEVNIETDIIGKYVAKLLGRRPGDGDERLKNLLVEQGFVR